DGRHARAEQGHLCAGARGQQPVSRQEGQLHGLELRRHYRHRLRPDQLEGSGAGQRRRLGRAQRHGANVGGQEMKMLKNLKDLGAILALWLLASGIAFAQANSIEGFDVAQQGGNVVVRITTREPVKGAPASFTVANPARIVFDFPNTSNALGRNSQDVSQGELRSMNLVQGADRTRLVLNLRRSVSHEVAVDGRTIVVTLAAAATAPTGAAGQVSHFADGRADAKHAVRDIDFRRGNAGEGRILVDLTDTSTGIDIRQQGQNIVIEFLKTSLPDNLRRRLDVVDFATPVQTVSAFQQ